MASKIAVIGDVDGKFEDVFSKLSALHNKNSFAFAIIAGNLFADPTQAGEQDESQVAKLLDGNINVPVSTYCALGRRPLPQTVLERLESADGELCPNLYFLGKRATIKTSEGIRLVSLGGLLDPGLVTAPSKDKYTPFHSLGDASDLKGANTADILLTSMWPERITKGSKVDLNALADQMPPSHQCVADLCTALRPRYHFSTSGTSFYEREPFFHPPLEGGDGSFSITRFISLASFGNPSKQKWIYAFSLDPKAAPPVTIPPGTTASPLTPAPRKRPADSAETYSRFSQNGSGRHHDSRGGKRQRHQPPPGPADCFFCLANPNAADHLVTSLGTEAYLTTSKGPLTTATTFPALGFPCHILLIPMHHEPTLSTITPPDTRTATVTELQRYQTALRSMLRHKAGSSLGAVTWEVSRASGVHSHWQFLPMPADLVARGLVEAAFKVEAENQGYPAFEVSNVPDGEESGDYFNVWIWRPGGEVEDGESRKLTLPLDASFRFDLQMGRRVLAKLLGLDKRAHWRDCDQSMDEEVADVEAFREAFKTFDFTLDE